MRHPGLATMVVAATIVVGGAVSALDCFIVSRSDQGDAAAGTRSQVWATVTVEGFVHSPGFPPGFDPDCFLEEWSAGGGPASFTVRVNKVIAGNSSSPRLADGTGLEHIEAAFAPLFAASLAACAVSG